MKRSPSDRRPIGSALRWEFFSEGTREQRKTLSSTAHDLKILTKKLCRVGLRESHDTLDSYAAFLPAKDCRIDRVIKDKKQLRRLLKRHDWIRTVRPIAKSTGRPDPHRLLVHKEDWGKVCDLVRSKTLTLDELMDCESAETFDRLLDNVHKQQVEQEQRKNLFRKEKMRKGTLRK